MQVAEVQLLGTPHNSSVIWWGTRESDKEIKVQAQRALKRVSFVSVADIHKHLRNKRFPSFSMPASEIWEVHGDIR